VCCSVLLRVAVKFRECVAVCCGVCGVDLRVCCNVFEKEKKSHVFSFGAAKRQYRCLGLLQCVTVCCSVLQRLRCSVLGCVAVFMSAATWQSSGTQCVAVCCSLLQCVAVYAHPKISAVVRSKMGSRVCCSVYIVGS